MSWVGYWQHRDVKAQLLSALSCLGLTVPMSVGLPSLLGRSLPSSSCPGTRSCSHRPPEHLPFCGAQVTFLILCSPRTEINPKEEACNFQADALCKNTISVTVKRQTNKQKKKARRGKGYFYFGSRQISGCYYWNQTSPTKKKKRSSGGGSS